MATHSSILAWEIPWTEECGGPQSMGQQESDTNEHSMAQHNRYACIDLGIQVAQCGKESACQ